MATVDRRALPSAAVLRAADQAADHVAGICFKTGPPRLLGAELEWTVHRVDRPGARLDIPTLRTALAAHAPAALGNLDPPVPLPGGGTVTVEPGGQVEISSAPATSLAELQAAVSADLEFLSRLLGRAGLALGETGIDEHRSPRRVLHTARYAAMQRMFDTHGRYGRTMMCSTAGLQICLDAGPADRLADRWAALHEVGPALLALFATSSRHAGRDTGWASGRMAAWYGIDPRRTRPVPAADDLAAAWARYALDAPLLCVRRTGPGRWDAPAEVTFADWITGALPVPPTVDDLDYHLGTLFPPVRPRGYLEVRYLDAQPGEEWIAPVAVLTSLFADPAVTDAARAFAAPAAGRWVPAARAGLADPAVATAAAGLADLACRNLPRTGLPTDAGDRVVAICERRLRRAAG